MYIYDEIHEKNSRTHLNGLQNKCTNYKGIKNNTYFGQINGIQEKLDTTCKQNASKQITQSNETLLSKGQKKSWQTFEQTYGYVRLELVNKWPNFRDTYDDDDDDDVRLQR